MTSDVGGRMQRSVALLLGELLDGPTTAAAFILNPDDPGLMRSIDRLSADAASRPGPTGSSIAAHIDHLRYGFELLNRWAQGENPFADANYAASWRRQTVTDAEWSDLRQRLRVETIHWREAVQRHREIDHVGLMGVLSSAVHLAYHIGAIRQIDPGARGPVARD
jgi:hypothetical protein